MKVKIALVLIYLILINIKILKAGIEVKEIEIENIDISITNGYIVTLEFENEVQGLLNLDRKYITTQKLNNKAIIIYTNGDNLPKKLGKIIITDSACNKYVLLVSLSKDQKDKAIYIKNARKGKDCEAVDRDSFYAKNVIYSREELK